jgi:hypothetical protein
MLSEYTSHTISHALLQEALNMANRGLEAVLRLGLKWDVHGPGILALGWNANGPAKFLIRKEPDIAFTVISLSNNDVFVDKVKEAHEFLIQHEARIKKLIELSNRPAELDFGVVTDSETDGGGIMNHRFPPEFLDILHRLGITLNVSVYY